MALEKLLQNIKTEIINLTDGYELEARFGSFTDNKFTSGISAGNYFRVLSDAQRSYAKYTYISSKDEIYENGERFTTEYDNAGLVKSVRKITKERIKNFDFPEYFFRISVSRETVIDIQSEKTEGDMVVKEFEDQFERLDINEEKEIVKPDTKPKHVRIKKRYSFALKNSYRLDLTEVTSYDVNSSISEEAKTIYEIEIESVSVNPVMSQFAALIENILKKVLNTRILYTQSEKNKLVNNVNRFLGSKMYNSTRIDHKILNQARDLKVRDMVVGGIVPKSNNGIFYTVTIKADGYRKLLVVDTTGLYLVMAPNDVMKINDNSFISTISEWVGTIFEGELIPPENLKLTQKPPIYFLIYDCLSIGKDYSVRDLSHKDRLSYVDNFMSLFNPNIWFYKKDFLVINSVDTFYGEVNKMLGTTYPYKTDGLIFTPYNYKYSTGLASRSIKESKLSKYPDVCKWKPVDELTIDFRLVRALTDEGNTYYKLLSGTPSGAVEFEGTETDPFNSMSDLNLNGLNSIPTDSIVEFKYSNTKLEKTRVRTDKTEPNRLDVAVDVWDDIMHPITRQMIIGEEFGLSFRYHNRIKWQLYGMMKVDDKEYKMLLCIGSGRGGDVMKWKQMGFTHVICVEPDSDNRNELERRLLNSGLEYLVLPYVGQNVQEIVDAIPGGKVDAIVYMLSLSFFFDNQESFESIFNLTNAVINDGGYFGYFSIDGALVKDLFSNNLNYTEQDGVRSALFKLITMRLNPDDTVYIDIPGSIVKEQTEYLTDLDLLDDGLMKIGFTKLFKITANKEKMMTKEELIYSSLYSGAVYKKV